MTNGYRIGDFAQTNFIKVWQILSQIALTGKYLFYVGPLE